MNFRLLRDLSFVESVQIGRKTASVRTLSAGTIVASIRPEDLPLPRDRTEAREMVDRYRARNVVRIVFDDVGTWRTAVVGTEVVLHDLTRKIKIDG